MRPDPKYRPMLAIEFRLADGGAFRRSWCLADADAGCLPADDTFAEIPDWLDNPLQSWNHPQDPVTYSGDVKPGREDEAKAFVDSLPARSREGTSE